MIWVDRSVPKKVYTQPVKKSRTPKKFIIGDHITTVVVNDKKVHLICACGSKEVFKLPMRQWTLDIKAISFSTNHMKCQKKGEKKRARRK